ncbi:NAD(P)-dependent oxidoreductase [Symbioplanes lichenis]|uniref:NAD(P)-dependent oxidoreductase n=1 Tax=Symbioplanes lichenis TaxID=1629072 RepID=UPI0027388B70|nr:NAD(P)-dependent oxidoreductase [Actinoplanes lichenis]
MTLSVAVLGTGIMGTGMTHSLLRAGLDVTVWNRSADKAAPLAADGATVASSPEEAVAGADIVITMLYDADSVAATVTPLLSAWKPGAVWVQSSTVGVEGVARLAALAADAGVDFLDAPVLGTKQPAENGQLVVLASGPSALRARVAPVLDAIGARTQWVSEEPGDGSKLKLVANAWIGVVVNGVAQSVALARGLGLDPAQFLEAVAGGAVDSPYVQAKGKAMIAGDFDPAFALDGVGKDQRLIADAMRAAGTDTTLIEAVIDRVGAASAAGHGDEDMSAVIHAY